MPADAGTFLEEDTMMRRTMKIVGGAALATVCVVGIWALATPARAAVGHCICPDIVAPVKCSNGVTYINGCRASCAGATGCKRVAD